MFEDFTPSSTLDGYVSDLTVGGWWSESAAYSPWQNHSFSDVVGTPTTYIGQTTPFTCAIVSQQMILNDFGINVSEAQLVYDATSNGWLTEGGTTINNMGNLLEHYGISTHINHSGDLTSVIDELAHGRKIIVPVNSDELWNGVSWWQRLTGLHNTGPDHAIVVTGVDFSNPSSPQVIVNDPGHPDGAGQAYPLDRFLESWNDSNYTYLATDTAPADLSQHASLGPQFNGDIYATPEFWIDIATKIAGVAIAAIVTGCFTDGGMSGESVAYNDFSPWEALTDAAINQLFLTI